MTGNDIVDIRMAAAESNWKREGYLEKIFTPHERQYITDALAPDEMVWHLWSMKESAYKIYIRQYGGRFFAPQKFSCMLQSSTAGLVLYNNNCYQTNTINTKKYIYTIAWPSAVTNTPLLNSCFTLPKANQTIQQQFIYKKIISNYHSLTGQPKENMVVAKDKNGVPFLYCGNNLQVPVSITHHGHFAAFTIH
jgi:phosphopantetheinyl transferase (holo-ACP synthase)